MGSRSTPTMVELRGMHQAATCIQPPGAAQRSMRTEALLRKLYFRLSWTSLQEALDLYPCILAKWQQVSSLCFDLVFLPIVEIIISQLITHLCTLNYNMDPREKLNAVQEQKRKLRDRIQQMNKIEANTQAEDPELERLMVKKKELDQQRRRQAQYNKLQKQYNQRRKQMEREKELERVKNQKRVLQLQVAMKRAIFEGVKHKVKGMNSEQIMRPDFLISNDLPKTKFSPEDANFKQAFQGYLLEEGNHKEKPKYDIKKLNEERLAIFQKKEEVIMRQLLLKQIAASPNPIQIDVLSLTREQLEDELEERGIDFEEFMHPIRKEQIIDQYPLIEKAVNERISDKRKEIEVEKDEFIKQERKRRALRQEVNALPYKDVEVVKRLLYDLFDEICNDYEKRHVPLSQGDKEQRLKNLQEQYQQICDRNLVQELANQISEEMLENMRKQMLKESAEEISKLHDLAHLKTEQVFKSVFGQGNLYPKLKEYDQYKIPLLFVNEQENQIGKPKNQKYMKKLDNDFNIYETEDTTTSLINDINLLDAQQKYLDKVNTQVNKEENAKTEQTIYYYDRELFSIGKQGIKTVFGGKVYYHIQGMDYVTSAHKIHRVWLLQNDSQILLITPWGKEQFGQQIGARISNPSGTITFSSIYPIQTFLGHPSSAILGFEKGQILKFNFNRNRLNLKQTNITHYLPVIQNSRSGDEPAFPLDNRNYLTIEQEKPKPTDQLHQYRQFFQYHTDPVIFIGFYRVDKMISIDRSLKCALWEYNKSKGANTYEPVFKFDIKSTYQVYNQDQNPRYKDIYPTNKSDQTPEEVYQKYMLTQAFLKLQLYNNPKKQIAYFKSPNLDNDDEDERPIWKVTYKQSRGQVNKILQSFYNIVDGKIVALQAQIQGDNVVILCQRQHIIRNDLKTIKLYSWNITEKKLGKVGIQIDMFKDQKVSNFQVLPSQFRGCELELVLVVNSGRLLLFSMVSGQLLKNINEELGGEEKYSEIYFKSIIRAPDKGIIYGITTEGILQLNWEDNNNINERNKLNKTIDTTKRKYFR